MAKEYERMKHRLEYVSQRHMYYKTQCRQLKSNKEETERAFNDRVKSLKAENKELRESNGKLKAQISQMTADFNQTTYHPQVWLSPPLTSSPSSSPTSRPLPCSPAPSASHPTVLPISTPSGCQCLPPWSRRRLPREPAQTWNHPRGRGRPSSCQGTCPSALPVPSSTHLSVLIRRRT